jgi:transposase
VARESKNGNQVRRLLALAAIYDGAPRLTVPANISIVPLPAKCPELNAQENVWQFLRENWLSNRIFTCHDNLVDHCCHAWNKHESAPRII